MNDNLDFIIIGGGISSLYSSYKLLKEKPDLNILILEKNENLGGRIQNGYFGDKSVDLGAVRIPKDFINCINLIKELGLETRSFSTKLNNVYTRGKFFEKNDLHKVQSRFFLPENTPESLTAETLLNRTLKKILGTLDVEKIHPNMIIKGKKLYEWSIYNLLRSALTEEQINWICSSIDFGYYKKNWSAYSYCKDVLHSEEFCMVSNKNSHFGNMYELIDKLDKKTTNVAKKFNKLVKKTFYNYEKKLWEVEVEDTFNNVLEKYYSKILISTIPILFLKNLDINVPDKEKWNYLLNSSFSMVRDKYYLKYPSKWWQSEEGSFYDNSANKSIWVFSPSSTIILASYLDAPQINIFRALEGRDLMLELHKGVCRVMNVSPNAVPEPEKVVYKRWDYISNYIVAGINVDELVKTSAKPFDNMPLFLSTDSITNKAGWIEGSLICANFTVSKILEFINLK